MKTTLHILLLAATFVSSSQAQTHSHFDSVGIMLRQTNETINEMKREIAQRRNNYEPFAELVNEHNALVVRFNQMLVNKSALLADARAKDYQQTLRNIEAAKQEAAWQARQAAFGSQMHSGVSSSTPTRRSGPVFVRAYTRKDGTHVRSHYRSRPSR